MLTIKQTSELARKLHHGQVDKAGAPYFGHVVRVAANLLRLFPNASLDEHHAAFLHDVMEDCGITAGELSGLGYSENTISIIQAVTRVKGENISYADWIWRLSKSGDIGAIRVKIADLSDNLAPARLETLKPQRAHSLAKRYNKAIKVLIAALD
jgi:(p)ppGpp synthase/HD superfamily hydrolase